ncbi:MAG: DUF3108 domain-containing protein [Bacteroidales bacterium]|nr:DUF3108 domain-containing protein [Bacteroidales bacterium]
MKHSNLTFIFALLFAALTSIAASAQGLPFQGGEKLSYKLHYKWGVINADIARLEFNIKEENYNGTPCFRIVTKGATSNLAASIVKVQYYYDSRFSQDGLIPLSFYREQTEGSYWAKNNYTWSANGKQLRAVVDKSTRPHRDTTFKLNEVIHDVIGSLYCVRAADLDAVKAGKTLHLVTALDCNINDLTVSYVKTEEKKVPDLGTVTADKYALYFRTRKGGERLDKESHVAIANKGDGNLIPIYLWITPDESRIIVSFSAAIAVGNVVGRLVESHGTKRDIVTIK